MSSIILIPTYNEKKNLPIILKAILEHRHLDGVDVLVIDDNSPDGTGDIAEQVRSNNARVHVLHRQGKGGLGAAYVAGYAWALRNGYDYIVQMDADGSHLVGDVPRLLGVLPTADVAVGSRYVEGGVIYNWPISRRLVSRIGNMYAAAILGVRARDITGGFRAMTRDAVLALNIADGTDATGYAFQTEIMRRAHKDELCVIEVPITFTDRRYGESKLDAGVARESLVKITKWGIADRRAALAYTLHTEPHCVALARRARCARRKVWG